MKRIQFRHRCGQLGIDYDIDIETQRAIIKKPLIQCEDCDKITEQSHKLYQKIIYGRRAPYWIKKCLECGEKTPLYKDKKRKD